jgi:hypothetical protein
MGTLRRQWWLGENYLNNSQLRDAMKSLEERCRELVDELIDLSKENLRERAMINGERRPTMAGVSIGLVAGYANSASRLLRILEAYQKTD